MKVDLSPGHRCLLKLLQRKLLDTVEAYHKLATSLRVKELEEPANEIDQFDTRSHYTELKRLENRIIRLSAKQKRYIKEIMHGNGNNTITKENYLNSLGLVTKEASNKLASKPNERRRRTTANPRFSHEAIQAKKALEPFLKRLDPKIRREMVLYG